ncbi:hypothetical protein LNI98_01775 [Tenacibaculum dicentrarchi]|uniref:Uncharacterized protein n=1 Tax=Tenacibaculum dicentrarchi TaxID=669041 RepID=A0ABP1EMH7_9FLAO|nr:hypothetical protein [Tenacibaculum dicentrarchi]SOS47544.1 conserved hypothetical protein [Tenacibaculum dicentrarchi]SOS53218.1 conserved hypothetical protein [Tenacibaculum dicentrarchi]SOU87016.1 conserved hypothetical protein [Tenacibaculum dicentrarchi]
MNYNPVILSNRNFDTEFIDFINSYQNLYQNIILENTICKVNNNQTLKKRKLKQTLEDFFFTPKYNVLDIFKLKKV